MVMSGGQPRHGWGHRLRELLGGDLLGCRGARDQPGVRSSAQALKRRGACSGGHVKGEGGVRRAHFRRRTAHNKRAHIGRVQIFKNVSRRSAVLTADMWTNDQFQRIPAKFSRTVGVFLAAKHSGILCRSFLF